jgi:hypothetical protein
MTLRTAACSSAGELCSPACSDETDATSINDSKRKSLRSIREHLLFRKLEDRTYEMVPANGRDQWDAPGQWDILSRRRS